MDATKRRQQGRFWQPLARGVRFLRAFFSNPSQVASIVPSSSALQRELGELEALATARCVVELGPGTGETTQSLLRGLGPSSKLVAIEVVEELIEHLRSIRDPRLQVVEGDALDLRVMLNRLGLPAVDLVVSGIPFSHLSEEVGQDLVEQIHSVLAPGGTFVAYQMRDRVCERASERFGTPAVTFVPWNIPPLRVFVWRKSDTARPSGAL